MSVRQRRWTDAAGKTQTAWVVDIEFEHGDGRVTRVRKTSPVDTRRGAEQYEREIRNALLAGTWGVRRKEIPTFGAFAERWMAQTAAHNKGSSQKAQRDILNCHLLPAFESVKLDQIDTAAVDGLSARLLAKKLSKKTVNNILACLSGLLSLANEWGELPALPTFKWLKAEKPGFDFLTFEEADKLHAAAEPGRWQNMIGLILNTGLRIGEVAGLQWKDIDLRAGRLMVRRRVYRGTLDTPKGGHEREIPLNEGVRDVLAKIPRRLDIPWVFPQRDGQFIRHPEHAAAAAIHRQVSRAGIGRVITWHDLRHTFASHLVMKGVPLKVVQELLGHQSISITERYAHLAPDVKNSAVKALDGHTSDVRAPGVVR